MCVSYVKGTTRDVPMFDRAEVEALAEALKQPRTPVRPSINPSGNTAQSLIATRRDNNDNGDISQLAAAPLALLERLTLALEALKPRGSSSAPDVPVADKVMLTVPDAAALTSLSSGHLKQAIHAGELKAKIIGRGWKVKRADLDAYVKKV